jgi:hypothetical protein
VGEEAAHDAVADVQGERRAEERRRLEARRHEAEPARIRKKRGDRGEHPLYSAVRVRAEGESILKRLIELGEAKLVWLAEELLANPHVAAAFSQAVRKVFETKGRMDRNIQTLLALLNLPSRADLNRIVTKLDALQGSLVNLSLKVDRLLSERPPRRRRGPHRPAEPSSDEE